MPNRVSTAFERFLRTIELSGNHHKMIQICRNRVAATLGRELDIHETFASGSIPRSTALREAATLDIFVALHYGKHIEGKKPSRVLHMIRDCLPEDKASLRRHGHSVLLSCDDWPDINIFPVYRTVDEHKDVVYYDIPNTDTEMWIRCDPKKHNQDMSVMSQLCGPRFKRIVKMMKWWNRQHGKSFTSYHIEVMALRIFHSELTDYPWSVFTFFNQAASLLESLLWHDVCWVDAYLTGDARSEAARRLESARDKALTAWQLTLGAKRDDKSAIHLWRQIFGEAFPAHES